MTTLACGQCADVLELHVVDLRVHPDGLAGAEQLGCAGEGLWVGGVMLPTALADLGVIDEYEFVAHPTVAGHGPTLLAGLRDRIQLELVDHREFRSGATVLRYRPVPGAA